MSNFVRQRDAGVTSPEQSADSNAINPLAKLKVSTKGSADPKFRQVWSRTRQLESSSQYVQQQKASQAPRPFYDTDASDIDATSTTASVKNDIRASAYVLEEGKPAEQYSPHSARSGTEAGTEDDQSESGSEEDDSENEMEAGKELDGFQLNRRQYRIAEKMFPLPYAQGDSYPNTTSGNPSIVDSLSRQSQTGMADLAAARVQSVQSNSAMRTPLDQRGSPDRLQRHQGPGAAINVTSDKHVALVSRPYAESMSVNRHVFEQNPHTKPEQERPPSRSGYKDVQNAAANGITVRSSASSNAAQPTSERITEHAAVLSPRPLYQQQAPKQSRNRHQAAELQQRHQPVGHETLYKPAFIDAPTSGQLPHVSIPRGSDDHGSRGNPEPEQSGPQLDYDLEELSKMTYDDLKKQPFDVAPNAAQFVLPNSQANALEEKLSAVSSLQQSDQARFFESLNIDEWDEAGEWFMGRFADVFRKLKDTRAQRRRAAQDFETEIEKRHSAVGRKRKQMEDALLEMRKNGGQILQGTPKKTRI